MRKSPVPLFSLMLVLALLVSLSAVTFAQQGGQTFTAQLMGGSAEVPPGDPDGSGSASVTLNPDQGQVCFDLSWMNITLPAQAAHIHQGAAGVAGPVVVPFFTAPVQGNSASACVSADQAVIQAIMTNPANYYVNVHTTDFPAGAIRGQLSQAPATMPDTGVSSGTLPLIVGLTVMALLVGFILRRSVQRPANLP